MRIYDFRAVIYDFGAMIRGFQAVIWNAQAVGSGGPNQQSRSAAKATCTALDRLNAAVHIAVIKTNGNCVFCMVDER